MATAFLPPILHSPFGKAFNSNVCSSQSRDQLQVDSLKWDGTRFISGTKPGRIVSMPTPTPVTPHKLDENDPLEGTDEALTPSKRRAQSLTIEAFPAFEDMHAMPPSDPPRAGMGPRRQHRSSSQSWTWPQNPSGVRMEDTPEQAIVTPTAGHGVPFTAVPMEASLGQTPQKFKRWAETFRGRRRTSGRMEPKETGDADVIATLRGLPISRHQTRTSNASSRFVNTIKTASFSNDSMSILQRQQMSQLSDHRLRSSEPRSSVDSRRPSSVLSADEAAPRRAIKRRQFLNELLGTEEQYVLDLKALHNLFSTLLASTPSVTSQLRTSIQRNVTEMLHLHEQIVNDLHRCGLRAALRGWKHPAQSETKPIPKWQSVNVPISQALAAKLRRGLVSPDTRTPSLTRPELAADPEEAAEAASILGQHVASFFIYEEYCAKYEQMAQELANSHKMVPQWQVFEAGLEALANSVAALDQREGDGKKGLMAADLLIKPVQRICRYPLLLGDLYRHTPVIDCPKSHAELESSLSLLRDAVREINMVANDPRAREQIQRRWLLQERLDFGKSRLTSAKFRMLGSAVNCGVLHVVYRTNSGIRGRYMMSLLFQDFLLVAKPVGQGKFEVVATIYLADAKVVSTEDGRGLQCYNALFSWKIVFDSDGQLHELLFSACSATEQEQWLEGIDRGRRLLSADTRCQPPTINLPTTTLLDLNPLGPAFSQVGLTRRISIQRAATVGSRIPICPVIIKNTHKPHDSQDSRSNPVAQAINRSQSLLTTHRTIILAPKRSERVRLEQSLADVWTHDTLPYPGMALSRGGSMIRASAGSLVRKLSLVSIHAPFSKRSVSGNTHFVSYGVGHGYEKTPANNLDVDHPYMSEFPTLLDPLRHDLVLHDIHDETESAGHTDDSANSLISTALPPLRSHRRRLSAQALRVKAKRDRKRTGIHHLHRRGASRSEAEDEQGWMERKMVEQGLRGKIKGMGKDRVGRKGIGKGKGRGIEKEKGKGTRWTKPLETLVGLSADGWRGLVYSSRS